MGAPYRILLTLLLALAANTAPAAQYQIDDPIPPGAQGTVSLLSGEVRELVGVASAVAGRVDPLAAALKDLGAKVTDTEIRIELAADVLFDFDKSVLRAEAVPSLEKVAEVLRSKAGSPVTIEGHTDGKGSDAYNQPLSEKRAQAVRDWLVKNGGATAAKITTKGWGKTKPIVPNTRPDGSDDPDGRKKNRRVEITVRTG
jgi:outer membrane protein OmpA-like peptidoglycan-associated protein